MSPSISRSLLLAMLATAFSQAEEGSSFPSPTGISGSINNGTSSTPAANAAPLDVSIQKTVTTRIEVQESPEFPELPPVKGTITATVQLVEDPGLPDPPLVSPTAKLSDAEVQSQMAEIQNDLPQSKIIFVSATVYAHNKTYLRWYLPGPARKEMGGWSNLDFNHFGGFSAYQVASADGSLREYVLLMALGNQETPPSPDGENDPGSSVPALPDLETSGPGFVVTEGDTSDREGMEVIEGMHALYRVEGQRMKSAYLARTKAKEERMAELLASPKVPADVVIQFWKRTRPLATPAQPQNETTNP